MPTVFDVIQAPGGDAIVDARVAIRLVTSLTATGEGFVPASDLGYVDVLTVATDATGRWEADLQPNSDIQPANSYYEARVYIAGLAATHTFEVPDGAGPYHLYDILVTAPSSLPTIHESDTADAHDASAVSFSPVGSIAATDVQAALAELDGEAAKLASANRFTSGAQDFDGHARFGSGHPWFDVTHPAFGAVGGGVTDDWAAVQSAIDAAEAAGGGTVFFPAGTYLVSSALVVDDDHVFLIGAGAELGTFSSKGTTIKANAAMDAVVDFRDAPGSGLADIGLDCNQLATRGFRMYGYRCWARDFVIYRPPVVGGIGFELTSGPTPSTSYSDIHIYGKWVIDMLGGTSGGNQVGIKLTQDANVGVGGRGQLSDCVIEGGVVFAYNGYGLQSVDTGGYDATGTWLDDIHFNPARGATPGGIQLDRGGWWVVDCEFDYIETGPFIDLTSNTYTRILGCMFKAGAAFAGGQAAININASTYVTVLGNTYEFDSGAADATYFVEADGSAPVGVVVLGNVGKGVDDVTNIDMASHPVDSRVADNVFRRVNDSQVLSPYKTRSIWIPVSQMTADGATANTRGTAPEGTDVFTCADAASQGVTFTFVTPRDFTQLMSPVVYWTNPAGVTDKAAKWQFTHRSLLSDVSSGGTTLSPTPANQTRTASTPAAEQFSGQYLTGPAAGVPMRVNLRRIGGDAADTVGDVVDIYGIRLDYQSVT